MTQSANQSFDRISSPTASVSPANQMQSTPLSSPHSSPTRSYAYEDNILADYNTTTTTAYVSDTTDNTTANISNSTISEQPITSIQGMVRHKLQNL